MISDIVVYLKDGKTLSTKFYKFSFHGLDLNGNVYKFLSEKSPLTVQDIENKKLFYYIPYEEIEKIEELYSWALIMIW